MTAENCNAVSLSGKTRRISFNRKWIHFSEKIWGARWTSNNFTKWRLSSVGISSGLNTSRKSFASRASKTNVKWLWSGFYQANIIYIIALKTTVPVCSPLITCVVTQQESVIASINLCFGSCLIWLFTCGLILSSKYYRSKLHWKLCLMILRSNPMRNRAISVFNRQKPCQWPE